MLTFSVHAASEKPPPVSERLFCSAMIKKKKKIQLKKLSVADPLRTSQFTASSIYMAEISSCQIPQFLVVSPPWLLVFWNSLPASLFLSSLTLTSFRKQEVSHHSLHSRFQAYLPLKFCGRLVDLRSSTSHISSLRRRCCSDVDKDILLHAFCPKQRHTSFSLTVTSKSALCDNHHSAQLNWWVFIFCEFLQVFCSSLARSNCLSNKMVSVCILANLIQTLTASMLLPSPSVHWFDRLLKNLPL